jgi:hypothetical protein
VSVAREEPSEEEEGRILLIYFFVYFRKINNENKNYNHEKYTSATVPQGGRDSYCRVARQQE